MSNSDDLFSRARTLHQAGDLVRAEQLYRQDLAINSANAQGWYLLGVASLSLGKIEQAVSSLQTALKVRPNFAEAHNHLGLAFVRARDLDKAIASFRQAVRIQPNLATAHNNLGMAFKDRRKLDDAVASFRAALRASPDWNDPRLPLARALTDLWKLDEAAEVLREALRRQPTCAAVHNAFGLVLLRQGRADVAAERFSSAVRLDPENAAVHSAMLLALHYGPRIDSAGLFEEHRRWAEQHAGIPSVTHVGSASRTGSPAPEATVRGLRRAQSSRADPATSDPHRRLRVGYVSADFREHPVAHFIGPVLAARDRSRFEVIGYSDVAQPDPVTQRLSGQMDQWRPITELNDEALAELVVKDEIDILVDLTGHAGKNRLLAFARRPAPIQVTHFGYPNTTGLAAMDYRMTDPYADPPGTTERFHTEKLVRLPEVAWCYEASASPPVNELPAREAGHVTFASFNNIPKVTSEVLALWARILKAVPNARMKLLTNSPGQSNERVWQAFEKGGVDRGRVAIVDRLPREQYLKLHDTVDIGLDPFPYNGAVTSCDALWMGVPVITLEGDTYVSRQGVSLLSNLGLQDLIAGSTERYVEIAIQLANDVERQSELRRGLRDRMKTSSVMDGARFARHLETAYRKMWEELLATQGARGTGFQPVS